MDLLHSIVIPLAYCFVIFLLATFIIAVWDVLMNNLSAYRIHIRERRMAQKISKDAVKHFRDEYEKIKNDPDFK